MKISQSSVENHLICDFYRSWGNEKKNVFEMLNTSQQFRRRDFSSSICLLHKAWKRDPYPKKMTVCL